MDLELTLFDPLRFVDDVESFPCCHVVEIKYGHIAMAAFVGMTVQELGVTLRKPIGCDGVDRGARHGRSGRIIKQLRGVHQLVAWGDVVVQGY